MTTLNCSCDRNIPCSVASYAAALIIGILTAFLRITGVLTIGIAFFWVALGIGVVYLPITLLVAAFLNRGNITHCTCRSLNRLLFAILGTILFSAILLGFTFVTTSIIGAIITGLFFLFLTLIFTLTACLARCIADCSED